MSYLEPRDDDPVSKGFAWWRKIRLWAAFAGLAFILFGLLTGELRI
ncbi:MAG: hypothetical protein U9R07_16630 [Pseudomonadota bacterium]|nr:hypothetical protein [Pseudomonadota bacterium]